MKWGRPKGTGGYALSEETKRKISEGVKRAYLMKKQEEEKIKQVIE